ncbi:17226_t:CDS:2, partial [Racocetra persica]
EYVDYRPLNNIYLLDISQKNNYKWVNLYNPFASSTSTTSLPTPSPTTTYTPLTSNNGPNFGLIIGIVSGGFATPFNLVDTSSMHWTDLSFVRNNPSAFSASVVNDNAIFYFGNSYSTFTLNRVDKFDTLAEKWIAFNFSGINTTLARTSASYVQGVISNNIIYYFNPFNESTQHDLILVIGGYSQGRITSLNIKTFSWENLTNLNDGFRTGLYYHTSTLIDHYIIIAFGYDVNYYPNIYLNNYSNNISLLDISQKDNYKWVTSYVAQGGGSPTPTPRYITTPSEIFGVVGGII